MAKPKNQLFCRLDGTTLVVRQEQRAAVLNELGLMSSEALPILEETTQKAASFSNAPISIFGLAVEDKLWFKSAVGLSTIDYTNQLATQRKISLHESFSVHVIDSRQALSITDTLKHAVFTESVLTQHYGIKAYLGVPLINAAGVCIGTLEVMDWVVREFDNRDQEHLILLAQHCLGVLEQKQKSWAQLDRSPTHSGQLLAATSSLYKTTGAEPKTSSLDATKTSPIKLKLLSQLTQELKTPLTSVIGMASVLHREVYGPLSEKQKEYLEIIHDSGQNLISLVDEIVSLGVLSDRSAEINPTKVDVDMLCQQVISSLKDLSKQYQQILCFSIEPGNRIWVLDKEKIRQAVYYLIASVLEMSEPGGEVKIHVSQRNQALNIAVGISHPWLGNDFAESKLHSHAVTQALDLNRHLQSDRQTITINPIVPNSHQILTSAALMMTIEKKNTLAKNTNKIPRDILGLLFCCHLVELHGGRLVVQGSPSSGYRYVMQIAPPKSAPK
ncbi:MAG: GAF domain-containing sensor histidine kinase [Cyanobacteria bacterium P01_C01_bin.72]